MYTAGTAAIVVLSCLAGAEESGSSYSALVRDAPSGDLVIVEHAGAAREVRLYGIDAPEPGQPFADAAAAFLAERVRGKTIQLQVSAKDTEGRDAAILTNDAGEHLNHALLSAGLAWWDSENVPDDAEMKKLNARAIVGGLGIWSDPAPLSPWDYRKSNGLAPVSYQRLPAPSSSKEEKEKPRVLVLKGSEPDPEPIPVTESPIPGLKLPEGTDMSGLLGKFNPRIATDADGNPMGLALDNIGEIPYAAQFGFQEGDILAGVNGQPIRDFAGILGLAGALQNEKHFEVEIIRGGRTIRVPVDVP